MTKNIAFSRTERAWLRNLIAADINDFEDIRSRPVEEVGRAAHALAQLRIENMQSLLQKLTRQNINNSKRLPMCIRLVESVKSGHKIIFLPPYSPEFNPIENFWAALKARL